MKVSALAHREKILPYRVRRIEDRLTLVLETGEMPYPQEVILACAQHGAIGLHFGERVCYVSFPGNPTVSHMFGVAHLNAKHRFGPLNWRPDLQAANDHQMFV